MSRLAEIRTDSCPGFRKGIEDAVKGLEEVLRAAEARSRRMVSVAGPVRRRLALRALQAALSWRSDHLRGAMRAMVAVATSLCVVALTERREVTLPFLRTSYGIPQFST